MKKLITLIALALSVSGFAANTKIEIDSATSKLTYLAKKVTGQHTGEVPFKSGFAEFNKDGLIGGEFVVDMTKISVTDIEDKEYMKKFIDHMASDDFFMTGKYATSTLKIKSAVKEKGDTYAVKADLTIKDKTHPVEFKADVKGNKVNSTVVVDRTLYDIKYGSTKFFPNILDKAIEDKFTLTIDLTLKK